VKTVLDFKVSPDSNSLYTLRSEGIELFIEIFDISGGENLTSVAVIGQDLILNKLISSLGEDKIRSFDEWRAKELIPV
jgi:hypothetical protein